MSIAAPTQFAITGGATLTIAVTFGGAPSLATFSVNSNTYKFSDAFDSPTKLIEDIMVAASITEVVAMKLLQNLQFIISMYFIQANQSFGLPFSIAIT